MSIDGSVELDGTISLRILSEQLLRSILEIIVKDPKCPRSLKNKIGIKKGRLRTLKSLNTNDYLFLSNFFEPNTEKYYKVLEFAYGYKGKAKSFNDALNVLDKVFPLKWYNLIFLRS